MDSGQVDFIREIIEKDNASGKYEGRVETRFPPEPNGYLHLGHAKSICLNFGVAGQYSGKCHLRFDDSNPEAEEQEYVDSIKEDVAWLGFDWGNDLYFASDYFDRLYDLAVELIKKDKAYVCELGTEEFKEYRGVPGRPGRASPSRNRPVEESLDLFARMKNGEFEEGRYVLRAKIDMGSPNLHMRDPVLYRIKKVEHHRTGGKWVIYPTYDITHCVSDSLERITHSLCTLEFEVHRPLYDWLLHQLELFHPQQIEFARLNLTYTVMSKRKLLELVREGRVSGWDDPRLPTIRGIRRRGYTPASIRQFCSKVGVTKVNSLTDAALLEYCIREELNRVAPRAMAVFDPVKLVIENYPEGAEEMLEAVNNPEDESMGTRNVPFSRELYIERGDFMEEPPRKYYRLAPGREVRLRYGYYVTCTGVKKDDDGRVREVYCTYDPETRGGFSPDGRKVRGTIHWVCAGHCAEASVRLYDRLFSKERPDETEEGQDFKQFLNPDSLHTVKAMIEPCLGNAKGSERYQFERKGYFFVDPVDSRPGKPVFNRIVPLRDTWAKKQKQKQQKKK